MALPLGCWIQRASRMGGVVLSGARPRVRELPSRWTESRFPTMNDNKFEAAAGSLDSETLATAYRAFRPVAGEAGSG